MNDCHMTPVQDIIRFSGANMISIGFFVRSRDSGNLITDNSNSAAVV